MREKEYGEETGWITPKMKCF